MSAQTYITQAKALLTVQRPGIKISDYDPLVIALATLLAIVDKK